MPIASELGNVRRLRSVGFTDAQVDALLDVLGRERLRGFERFEETARSGLQELHADFRMMSLHREEQVELPSAGSLGSLRLEIRKAIHRQTRQIAYVFLIAWAVFVTLVKMIPDLY